MSYSDSVISNESGGNPNSHDPNSTASGLGGFINSTWVNMLRTHRPDLAGGKSDQDLIALKSDPDLNRQMIDAYATDNSAILAKNGLPVTPGTTYLAHFAGPQGAVSVLQADSNTPAADVLGPKVAAANPFLKNMTAGDLIAWAGRKMGISQGAAPSRPAAASGAPSGGILADGHDMAASAAPGILNAPQGDLAANFQNQLAALAAREAQQSQQSAPQMQPISFAMPKGLSRARLLAALNSPIGG